MSTTSNPHPPQKEISIMNPHRRRRKERLHNKSPSGADDDTISVLTSGSSFSRFSQSTGMATSTLPHHKADVVAAADNKKNKGLIGALIFALCFFNIVDVDFHRPGTATGGRRSLLSNLYLSGPSTLLPWAEKNLVGVQDRPDTEAETALFWHIPKSGGTTAKRLYQCMGQTLAHRVGASPTYGHDKESDVVVFEPFKGKDWKVVNVDTTVKEGIVRAKEMGLVQSRTTDLIFTMEPQFAGQELYDESNKGRFLSLFRHPVERAVSMFYYLQTATWERTYKPEWAKMSIIDWANMPGNEEDYMVKKLLGKSYRDTIDETDLIIAKELVRQRFIVGLMGEMNESIRRFNIVLGVDEEDTRNKGCMEEFDLLGGREEKETDKERKLDEVKTHSTDKKNSNKHPKYEEGSPEYEAVANNNRYDILLYKYVEDLFEAQKEIIDAFLEPEKEAGSGDEKEESTPEDESKKLALLPPGSAVESVSDPNSTEDNLANTDDPIEGRDVETPFFWHVPKSGGTTLQRLYWCMGATIANEVGVNPKFGHSTGFNLLAFSPWEHNPGKVINVDVCTHEGILEAKNRGFLTRPSQPHIDFISSSEFNFATTHLFSPGHKARMFALFRHPIDRAVSKFYYLQKATWEPTYNTRWADMTLEEWASRDRGDNNWLVRNLIDKPHGTDLTTEDLERAKEIVRTKFVVGIMSNFEESVHRFNLLLGMDESDETNMECINDYTANEGDKDSKRNEEEIKKKNQWNSYSHPKAERGSPAWVSLAKIHMYDNLLYRYITELFAEQRTLFDMTAVTSAN